MRRLIKSNFTAAGQLNCRLNSPVFFFGMRAAHAFSLQRFHECRQVVAHEVENRTQKLASAMGLTSLVIGGVNPDLCWRQGKYESTTASVDRAKAENVAEESTVGLRVIAVQEKMSTIDSGKHGQV